MNARQIIQKENKRDEQRKQENHAAAEKVIFLDSRVPGWGR